MFLILLVGSFISSSYVFFNKDNLGFSLLKEHPDFSNVVLTDFAKDIDGIYFDFSNLNKINNSYYLGVSYKNLDFDTNKSIYNISILRGFISDTYFGMLLVNYSLLKFYEYNNFFSLAMQTGKVYDTYILGLNYYYFISLNRYLSNRFKIGLDNTYKLNSFSKLNFSLYYYSLFGNDSNLLAHTNKYIKSNFDFELSLAFLFKKIKLDLYSRLVFNREVFLDDLKSSTDHIIYGIRLYYLGVKI